MHSLWEFNHSNARFNFLTKAAQHSLKTKRPFRRGIVKILTDKEIINVTWINTLVGECVLWCCVIYVFNQRQHIFLDSYPYNNFFLVYFVVMVSFNDRLMSFLEEPWSHRYRVMAPERAKTGTFCLFCTIKVTFFIWF